MSIMKKLIDDDVIDRKKIIIKRHKYLGLDLIQAKFIAKIFDNDLDHSNLTIKDISNKINIDENITKIIIQNLLKNNSIKVNSSNSELSFNLEVMIELLVKSYLTPEDSDSIETKLNWVKNSLSFELNKNNIEELNVFLINDNWNKISIITNKICNDEKANWPLFTTMMDALTNKKASSDIKLKNILNKNWLEE